MSSLLKRLSPRKSGSPRAKPVQAELGPFPEGGKKLRTDAHLEECYQLGNLLGEGATSQVREATDRATGERWACKAVPLPPADAASREQRAQRDSVLREVAAMLDLDHPCVVQLREYFVQAGKAYLILELLRGGELLDVINTGGPLSEDDARDVFRRLLEGVRYLHSMGVAHRDLKLENLVLAAHGDVASVKIADFGVAVKGPPSVLNSMTALSGSPQYVAPEVLRAHNSNAQRGHGAMEECAYGPQVDLWSCGVILFMLLGGYPPFWDADVKQLLRRVQAGRYEFAEPVWRQVSDAAKDLIRRLLVVDPDQRLTADQALAHPWMSGGSLDAGAELYPLLPGAERSSGGGAPQSPSSPVTAERVMGTLLLAVLCVALFFIVA